jgi:leucyl-tRNA synthetase
VNEVTPLGARPRALLEPFALVLAPFAPHLAEELWLRLGHTKSLSHEPWPGYDPALIIDDTVTVAVQVNGRVRATLDLPRGTAEDAARDAALADERIKRYVNGSEIRKVIYVPDKLLNLVVAGK